MSAPALPIPTAALPDLIRGQSGGVEITHIGNISAMVAGDRDVLAQYVPEWEELAADAAEPNVFYEPWMLLPALDSFGACRRHYFVLLFAPASGLFSGSPRLIGFVPLCHERGPRGLPVHTFRTWQHLHCFLGTPLLRAGHERTCWRALLAWVRRSRPRANLLELGRMAGDGPVYWALRDVLAEAGSRHLEREEYERALLAPPEDAETYVRLGLSREARKDLRRLRRRLEEQGELRTVAFGAGDDLEQWLNDFLRLEAKGWKGERGTALASRRPEEQFFRAACRGAAARGRLMLLQLRLGDRPVAMKCNFLAGAGAFAFKIAYDEEFARYSPGVQLELDNIALARAAGLAWMDSCAAADHFMINRLWNERRSIRTPLISTGRFAGNLVLAALPQWRWLRQVLSRRPKPSEPTP